MGWLNFKRDYTSKHIAPPQSFTPTFIPIGSFDSLNWGGYSDRQALKDFLEIPELNAILNIKANAAGNGIQQILSKKTDEPTNNLDPNVRILRNPNWFQSEKEFRKQSNLFHYIFGNEYQYFLRPLGMDIIKAMFTLPPQLVGIENMKEIPFFSTDPLFKYYLEIASNKIPLEAKDIIHMNDNNVSFDINNNGNFLKGVTKQAALKTPLENIRATYEARNIIIVNRGAIGMLSNDQKDATVGGNIPLDDQEMKDLQKSYQKYGITKGQTPLLLTNMALKWQQMSISTKELMLFEETREDTLKICDAHGVKFELLASVKGATFANQQYGMKSLYQETIIPEQVEKDSALNKFFDTDNKSWYIKTTFDHLPIFQDDIKERSMSLRQLVEALSKALADKAITIEQYREELAKYKI